MPSGCRKCSQCSKRNSCKLCPELQILTQLTRCGQVFCISMLENTSSVQTPKPTPRAIKRNPDIFYAAHGIVGCRSRTVARSSKQAMDALTSEKPVRCPQRQSCDLKRYEHTLTVFQMSPSYPWRQRLHSKAQQTERPSIRCTPPQWGCIIKRGYRRCRNMSPMRPKRRSDRHAVERRASRKSKTH